MVDVGYPWVALVRDYSKPFKEDLSSIQFLSTKNHKICIIIITYSVDNMVKWSKAPGVMHLILLSVKDLKYKKQLFIKLI